MRGKKQRDSVQLQPLPEKFFDDSGAPLFGSYLGMPDSLEDFGKPSSTSFLAKLFERSARKKDWVWVGAFGKGFHFSVAVVTVGYMGRCFGHFIDTEAKSEARFDWSTPIERGVAIQGSVKDLIASATKGKESVQIRALSERLQVRISTDRIQAEFDLHLDGQPITVVSNLGKKGSFGATVKQAGMMMNGFVVLDGRKVSLEKTLGAFDRTRGYFPMHTAWRWTAAGGFDEQGRALGINLSSGVHDKPGTSENTVWIDGKPKLLPRLHFDLISATALNVWTIITLSDAEHPKALLNFEPAVEFRRNVNLIILKSDFVQIFGQLSGTVSFSSTENLQLPPLAAILENHDARW